MPRPRVMAGLCRAPVSWPVRAAPPCHGRPCAGHPRLRAARKVVGGRPAAAM